MRRWLGFWTVAAIVHLVLVVLLLALFPMVGARSAWVALLVYAPRLIYAAPLLATVPALARRGARTFLWLPAVTAALIAGPLMGLHLNLPREPRRPSIRLLTYNVWFGVRDPGAIAEEVRAAMPDIVLFQAAAHPADVVLKSPPFEQYVYLHEASFAVA
ncbi:MAG TPA: hypothetical protein VE964_19260, partial [Myxococcales bacterium]|nr:hypothetical protein [Myxococcales bacterium]